LAQAGKARHCCSRKRLSKMFFSYFTECVVKTKEVDEPSPQPSPQPSPRSKVVCNSDSVYKALLAEEGLSKSLLEKDTDANEILKPAVKKNPEEGTATELQKEAIQYLRRSNTCLAILAILLAIVLPTAMWFAARSSLSGVASIKAVVADQAKLLHDYKHDVDSEQSQRIQDLSALQKHMDSGASAWAAWTAASDRSMDSESAQRAKAVAAVNLLSNKVNQRIEAESLDRAEEAKKATQLVEKELAEYQKDFPSSLTAVKKRLSIESSDRERAVPPLNETINAYTQNSTWWQPIGPVKKKLSAEGAKRNDAVTAVNASIDGWTNFEDSLMFVRDVEGKIRDGVCSYCLTCGGKWPMFFGGSSTKFHSIQRREEECEGGLAEYSGEETFKVCCGVV